MILEGKELEGDFAGGDGHYSVDVDAKGKVVVSASFQKDMGYVKAKSTNDIEVSIFDLAHMAVKKSGIGWGASVVEGLAKLLGIELEDTAEATADAIAKKQDVAATSV